MGRQTISLRDEITAALPSRSRRKWEEDLDPEVLAELEELRADWLAGKMPHATKTGLSKAISKTLTARGVAAFPGTVARWLDR